MDIEGDVEAFLKMAGQEFDFYGADSNHFKLGRTVWHAIEDESDGYRSYLGSIAESAQDNLLFPDTPFARVRVEAFEDHNSDGFRLIDVNDGHCWLKVGTDNTDDYYPSFMFDYAAKEPADGPKS